MPKHLTSAQLKKRNEQFQLGLLWCSRCLRFLEVDNFYKCNNRNSNFGYRFYCKDCEYGNRRTKIHQYTLERNRPLKDKFVKLAGGKCQRCGYSTSNAALDFHHVYPSQKKYNAVTLIYSGDIARAWKELDKCCLLCRNCHSTYEASEWKAEFVKRDGLGWTIGMDLPIDDDRYKVSYIIERVCPIPDELINFDYEQLELLN